MGHGFGYGDVSCIDWHMRHVRAFSALCPLASLRGVRRCNCRHGLACRLGLLGLFEKLKRAQPVSWALSWLFDQSEGMYLPSSPSLLFVDSKRSV